MLPAPLERLVEELQRLPSVGPKTAQRLAFYILSSPQKQAEALAQALIDVKTKLTSCEVCGNISDGPVCAICSDARRDRKLLCVVPTVKELLAIERTFVYKGLYHVLGGLISPLDGIGPDEIGLDSLKERLQTADVEELIIATNSTVAGEATVLYITKMLEGTDLRITRLATGLPVGGDIEYADENTLGRALSGRMAVTANSAF
ncbi:MAG: recombination mediator RecR [bacterium]|nr:recombination mediator RecR [bacterium]